QATFSEERAALKRLDSTKRHTHVAIGAMQKRLAALKASEASEDPKLEDDAEEGIVPNGEDQTASPIILVRTPDEIPAELNKLTLEREVKERDAYKQQLLLSEVSQAVEELRLSVEEREAAFVVDELRKAEISLDLPMQKLLQFAICPCCGTKQQELQES